LPVPPPPPPEALEKRMGEAVQPAAGATATTENKE
jgi:hypothetical protein